MARQQRTLTDEERALFDRYVEEFTDKPLDYVRHDSNARLDDALRRATAKYGMGFYGAWWLLIELLSGNKRHAYDVADDAGWNLLAIDMSTCGIVWSVEECRTFCDRLAEFGLIDQECYERGKVINNRVCREVSKYAQAAAGKSLGSWKTNRAKALGSTD